jgi:hypothetical protein
MPLQPISVLPLMTVVRQAEPGVTIKLTHYRLVPWLVPANAFWNAREFICAGYDP